MRILRADEFEVGDVFLFEVGDVFLADVGTEHVAHPLGPSRVLVVERAGSI